jgi:transcriptional regulator with XRE-family HTH domain
VRRQHPSGLLHNHAASLRAREPAGSHRLKSPIDQFQRWAFDAWPLAAYHFARRVQMVIGNRVKALRAQRNMSQGDVEKRTGLLRCYISRVENGHTVPSVDTLEKFATALEVPMYRFFTNKDHVKKPKIPAEIVPSRAAQSKQDRELRAFAKFISRMDEKYRALLFRMAAKMANRP